jgi:hypothetical protein
VVTLSQLLTFDAFKRFIVTSLLMWAIYFKSIDEKVYIIHI